MKDQDEAEIDQEGDGTVAPSPRRRGRPSRANGATTRRRLLKAATSLFSAGGYEATSLRQIAGAADVDLATLKYHFGDKAGLYAEVYSSGHQAFIGVVSPVLERMTLIETREELRREIAALSHEVHDFIGGYLPFVRMVLYRFLEDSTEASGVEDELQVIAIGLIEGTFEALKARGIVRDIDSRAFVTLLITGFANWFVTAKVKPHWLGEPAIHSPEGRRRSEAFFIDLMDRMLLA